MPIVGALDIHRKQITFDYLETSTGEVKRGQIAPADRELSLEQLFHMRPAPGFADYRTPVPGLYYASSATHAGGGVCGIPGMQAAKAAIAGRRAAARRPAIRRARRR